MINVWIPRQNEFEKYRGKCKELYEELQDKIGDDKSFEFICNNTFFYLFENDGELIGGIYYFKKNNKWYLNGFANRKMHLLCLKCLKLSLSWFQGSIYAEARNRASALCLLKCGFKRKKNNLFEFSNKS